MSLTLLPPPQRSTRTLFVVTVVFALSSLLAHVPAASACDHHHPSHRLSHGNNQQIHEHHQQEHEHHHHRRLRQGAAGCDHPHHQQEDGGSGATSRGGSASRHFPPRHPGDTEHAIVRFDPDAEVYYPLENGTNAEFDGDELQDERGLRRRKKKFRPAQRSCGVPDPTPEAVETSMVVLDEWERSNPGRRLAIHRMMQEGNASAVAGQRNLTVKVWWHVMRAGNTPALGKWTRAQVVASINYANQYFANSPFRFQLAGITQTLNAKWFACPYEESYATELEYKTRLRREGADTLNVYMCDLRKGQGAWGFAYMPTALKDWPEYDGVVVANPFTKPDGHTALDAQMTFIHEAGHWLGLYHTWTGTCEAKGGDTVRDTPAHVRDTWSYQGWENCFEGRTYNTCPDNVRGVDPGFDPLLNHMNYVYTPCQQKKGQFTAGQMTTMVSKFEFYRYNKTTCRKASVPCLRNVHCCSLTCVNATKLCA